MNARVPFAAAIVLVVCSCSGATKTAANPTPSYMPADCAHFSPKASAPAPFHIPTPSLAPNPTISTDVQLRVLDRLVEVIDQDYLYADFQGVDWNSLARDYRQKVQAGMNTETFYDGMVKLVTALADNHSQFQSPAIVTASNAELAGANDYVGIGVVVKPEPEHGDVSVLAVFPGSPAEHGGMKQHDNILAVDGRPIVEKGVASPQLVRGPQCSVAILTIQTPGKASHRIAVVRDKVTSPEPIVAQLVHTKDGSRIGYIFIPTFFDRQVPPQVDQALRTFGSLDGLILDDRMNPGGSSDVLGPVLSRFISGTLGHFVSRTSERAFDLQARPLLNSARVPLVVLVGKDTVSFGEIFAGILQDLGRAQVVGDTTLGNVETLHGIKLEDGSVAWIAEERFDPEVSHASWEGKGIVPNVKAVAEWDTFTFDTDPAVAAALKVLKHG
jgi:carboxyl-terminal processing protease